VVVLEEGSVTRSRATGAMPPTACEGSTATAACRRSWDRTHRLRGRLLPGREHRGQLRFLASRTAEVALRWLCAIRPAGTAIRKTSRLTSPGRKSRPASLGLPGPCPQVRRSSPSESKPWVGAYQQVPRTVKKLRRRQHLREWMPLRRQAEHDPHAHPVGRSRRRALSHRLQGNDLLRKGSRVTGVLAEVTRDDGSSSLARIDADHVFVCAGPRKTPSLLRRSGIKFHVATRFASIPCSRLRRASGETLDAQSSVLPLLQVKEFWPELSIRRGLLQPGPPRELLSDNWPETSQAMNDAANIGPGTWR